MSIAENHGGLYQNLRLLRETKGTAECNLFRAMGLDYRYVDEGNDVRALIDAFAAVKDSKKPVVVHIKTLKGKGYADREIPEATGIKPNILWLFEKQTRFFSEAQLKEYLLLCVQMDYEFKSGLISDESALDTIVMALVNRKKK